MQWIEGKEFWLSDLLFYMWGRSREKGVLFLVWCWVASGVQRREVGRLRVLGLQRTGGVIAVAVWRSFRELAGNMSIISANKNHEKQVWE